MPKLLSRRAVLQKALGAAGMATMLFSPGVAFAQPPAAHPNGRERGAFVGMIPP